MRKALQHLCQAVLRSDATGATDGQLLSCFIEKRDEASFATLVQRHGPMVLGVCRRILANGHDAEDAFQATFLVLVRKATAVVPREMVGNWLYGVARQTATKARAMAAVRQARERQMAEMPEPQAESPGHLADLHALLDRELGRLPTKYRAPIVLCDLEGKSQKETSEQLGWPQGTVSGRLARGRKLLARRLARYGLAVPASLLVGQNGASASVPAALADAAVKAAVASASVSAQVSALTQGVLQAMFLTQIKTVLVIVALVAASAGAGVWFNHALAGDKTAAPAAAEQKQIAEKPADKKTDNKQVDANNAASVLVGDFEIFHLKHARAATVAEALSHIRQDAPFPSWQTPSRTACSSKEPKSNGMQSELSSPSLTRLWRMTSA